jgi:hypothetical protein
VALIEELNREIEKDTPDNRKQLSAEISKYTDVWFSRHHYSEAVKSLRSFQEESKMHLAMVGLGQFTIKENDVVYKVGDKFGHLKILSINNGTAYVEFFANRRRFVLPIK